MGWLVLSAAVLGLLLVAGRTLPQREFLITIAALVFTGVVAGGVFLYLSESQGDRFTALQTGKGAPGLALTDVVVRGSGNYWTVGGAIANTTDREMVRVDLQVSALDCAPGDCGAPVAEHTVSIWLQIPPGATKPFSAVFPIEVTAPPATLQWRYRVGEVQMRAPSQQAPRRGPGSEQSAAPRKGSR